MNGCQRTVILVPVRRFVAGFATETNAEASRAAGLAAWQQVRCSRTPLRQLSYRHQPPWAG